MRLSSSSLEMASARISCALRSAKLFTDFPRCGPYDYIRTILMREPSPNLPKLIDHLQRPFQPLIRRFLHAYWRISRGLTVGVRVAVFDGDQRVFLVKHSYLPGWHLPGGGVEIGETILTALERELREEGNIELSEPPVLHAIYFNRRVSKRD